MNHDTLYQDYDNKQRSKLLRSILWGVLIMVNTSVLMICIILPENYRRWIIVIATFLILCTTLLYLNKRGWTQAASYLFSFSLIAICLILGWTAGGMTAPAMQDIPVMVMITGILLGWRMGILSAFLVLSGGLIMVIAQHLGYLPQNTIHHTAFSYWINSLIGVGLIAVLQFLSVSSLDKALRNTRKELLLRQQAEDELKKSEALRLSIFDNITVPIIILDAQYFKAIDCNLAVLKLFEKNSRQEILNLTLDEMTPSPHDLINDTLRSYLQVAIAKNPVQFNWHFQRSEGSGCDVETNLVYFVANDKPLIQCTLIDITHQKQTQRSLQVSESRIQSVSRNFHAGLIYQVVVDQLGNRRFTYLSDSVLDLYGITPSQGMADASLIYRQIHTDDIQRISQIEESCLQSMSEFKAEVRMFNAMGEMRWSSLVSTPRLLEDGSICWDGIEFIITDRKNAEEANLITTAQLRANLDNTPYVAVQWYNKNGMVLYWNKASETMYGWNSQEAVGKQLDNLFLTSLENEAFIQILAQIDNTGTPYGPYETIYRRKDGQTGWTQATLFSFPLNNREMGFACMDVDITDRKMAQKKLADSEELLKTMIMLTPYHIVVTNLNDKIVLANQIFCTDNGLIETEILGKTIKELNIKFDVKDEEFLINEILEKGLVDNHEIAIVSPLGVKRDYLFSSRIIHYKDNLMFLTTTIDITERKNIEKELASYRNHLEKLVDERTKALDLTINQLHKSNHELSVQKEELQKTIEALHEAQNQLINAEKMASLGVLSAGIAHEINNPLNFIHGGSLALQLYFEEELPNHLGQIAPLIEAINIGVQRASDIVSSLNHYSYHDDTAMHQVDIHNIIDNCLVMLQNQLKNKVTIAKHFTEQSHPVFGNEGKLHQAFLNIFANAEQSIVDNGDIQISTEITNNQIITIIKDNGCGIDSAHLKKIFDPFFTTKAPGKGTGLGLSIVYKIIQEHKGTIEIESSLNKGTMVTVKLPVIEN